MEQKFEFDPSFDLATMKPKQFKTWQHAVMFAQSHKMSLKRYAVIKVGDHYEIH